MKKKLSCIFGLHDYKLLGRAQYRYSGGVGYTTIIKQLIHKCSEPNCGKIKKMPSWCNEDFQTMYPCVDIHGFQTNWRPEFEELNFKAK